MKVLIACVLASFLAVAQTGVITESDPVAPYSIIDPIIKAILEGLKPKLANLTFSDINETVSNPNLNASILIRNMNIKNADKFVTKVLKTTMVPLKLNNLTLTWDSITASAIYDINVKINVPQLNGPINVFAKGNAKATLSQLFVTVGANMELKNNAVQIKPKGLFGFDLRIGKAAITLDSLMGSPELGQNVGNFLSKLIPEVVDTFKKPVFDAFHDDIVRILNSVLKKNGTTYMEDAPLELEQGFDIEALDLSDELNFESLESEEQDSLF